MKVLVIGGGGREHAIVHALSKSSKVTEIYAAPGNAGISKLAMCVNIKDTEVEKLVEFAKSEKMDLCLQLAEGLNDLNRLGYYHRDIKPDNIFIFQGSRWKIGDLGLVTHRELDYDRQNELIGPKGWLSPEAMNKYLAEGRGNKDIDCVIDNQSDIFQLGKVFWYILQGNAPIGCIKRADFHDSDESIYVLIRTMLNYSKKRRIKDMSEVVKELERILTNY